MAARLIRQELETSYARLLASGAAQPDLVTSDWVEHRAALARSIDERGWRDVAGAYSVLELVAADDELSREADQLIRRAQVKLDSLLDWSRDWSRDDSILAAYERHLTELLQRKRLSRNP